MTQYERTLIIAEAGVNHNGNIDMAKQLIEVAANAGADLVKFQTFKATNIATTTAPKANYQVAAAGHTETQHEMLQRLELSRDDHAMLAEHCQQCGIGFFSTGFDIEDIDFLIQLGIDRIKIPSGEVTNLPYLRHVGALALPIILSTGMCSFGDIEAALWELEASGANREQITILHCNTQYPTPYGDVNLAAMMSIGKSFGVEIGYSDHTMGIEVPIAAVALGAKVIEKHFTLDRNLPGPDHLASLNSDELAAMVSAIRNIEKAMGDGVKRPSKSEFANKLVARRSLVAKVAIAKGEKFTPQNLGAKRPGTGISPMRWDEVIGKLASRDFVPDEMITL